MHVPSGQIDPGSFAGVLVFDPHGDGRTWWGGAVLAAARLDAGLLVGADHIVVRAQGMPLPGRFVEIEDTASLVGEIGISGKDPAAMVPRADGVFGEPPPDGRLTDRSGQTTANDLSLDLGHAETREWKPGLARQFTGEGRYGDDGTGLEYVIIFVDCTLS